MSKNIKKQGMQPSNAANVDKSARFALQDDEKEQLLQNDDFNAVKTTNANSNEAYDKIMGSQRNSEMSKYITDYIFNKQCFNNKLTTINNKIINSICSFD